MDPPDPHKPWPRNVVSDSPILSGSSPYFLRFFFVIWHTWQVEHKQSMFNILCKTKPCHGIPDSLSVLVCPGWSKYSWYQDSTLCGLSQWLRNVDLFFEAKKIIPFNMLYKPFSLNPGSLTFACSLKIKAVGIGIVNLILMIKSQHVRKMRSEAFKDYDRTW
jgi:hypothetical protein